MSDSPVLLYPDWQPQYQAAMLELDAGKLEQRILAAHSAIAERMKVLAEDHYGTPEERDAIVDALNGLAMLERETRQRA